LSLARFVLRLLLGRRWPVTRGTLRVAGARAPLRIHRDRWGIPCIEADSELDAQFGVGFCHGQDRAFQLELLLRVGRGTLAALVGARALPVDRLSRRIGFYHSAAQQLPVLHPDVRALLESYAQGVCAGATTGCPRVPHEFVLLGGKPTPWTALDTLAFTKLVSFTLCANWDAELARLKILCADGPEALAALDCSYPEWQPVTAPPGRPAGAAVDYLAADLAEFLAVARPAGGSNNWAVAPWRTATGRPLLANDPHLDAGLPAHWYLAQTRTPQGAVAGATFVGGPTFLVGHNGQAAWGLTAGLIDNTDLFIEQIGPDGASVRQGDAFVPCAVREELIEVKGGRPVTERVLVTPRGPIVSPALPDAPEALSLRATWLEPRPIAGLLRVHHISGFEAFRRAMADWPAASQNVVYADTAGTIGWQLVGLAPRRRKGHGTIPLPGWDAQAGWEAEGVPFEDNPHLKDPECGFVATANNRPRPEGEGPFLGVDWIDGYRLSAILRALGDRNDWDVAGTMQLQMSQQAVAWEELRDGVLGLPADRPEVRRALDLLRDWDGRVAADSQAASVYELFLAEMARRLTRAKAPESHACALGMGMSPVTPYNFLSFRRTGHLVRLLREQPPGWFARPWPEEAADALAAAVRFLTNRRGPDPARWAWGSLRTLVLHHPLGRGRGPLARALAGVFNLGPVPCGGDTDSINQAMVRPLDPLAPTDNIASLRAVFDVGAWHNSRFALPGGQSGNPFSPHYGDLFPLWQRGEGVPIPFTPEEVRRAAVETLELRPA
jgi:penicillin amidase